MTYDEHWILRRSGEAYLRSVIEVSAGRRYVWVSDEDTRGEAATKLRRECPEGTIYIFDEKPA